MQAENDSFVQKLTEIREESKQDILDTSAKYQSALDSKLASETQKQLQELLTNSAAGFMGEKQQLSQVRSRSFYFFAKLTIYSISGQYYRMQRVFEQLSGNATYSY
jgi:hypothetical protein